MKDTYAKTLKLVNEAMEELFCTDDEPMTHSLYSKLNEIAELIQDHSQHNQSKGN